MIAADPIKYEIEDGVFTLEYLDPSLMVQLVTQEAPRLAALYLDKFSTKPCTREAPWHAIIAFDEFNPGNATAGTDSKKSMCLYFNFIEFENAALCDDATWYCPLVLSSFYF